MKWHFRTKGSSFFECFRVWRATTLLSQIAIETVLWAILLHCLSHSMPFPFFFRSSRSFLVRCIFAMHSLWRRKTCKFTSTKNVLWFLSCLFMKEKWKKKKTKFKLVLNYLRGFSMLISCFFLLCCSLSDSFTVQ